MKNILKKILPILMVAVLFVSLFPISAYAWNDFSSTVGVIPFNINNIVLANQQYYDTKGQYQILVNNGTEGIPRYELLTNDTPFKIDRATNNMIGGGGDYNYWYIPESQWQLNGNSAVVPVPEAWGGKLEKIVGANYIIEYVDGGNAWEAEISIDDIGLPERTMDYYIVSADVIDGVISNSIYYQEFNAKPIVTLYDEINATSNIYDMSWEGSGVSKKYLYSEATSTWNLVNETLPSNAWQESRSIKKIYGTNISLGVTGTIEDIAQIGNFGGGLDTEGFGIRFLLPRDGFVDNSFLFTYWVEYRIPWTDPSASPGDITLNFDGDGKADTMKVESSNYDIVNEVLIGTVKMSVGHEYGQNIVRAFIGSQVAPLYQASVRTTRLEGFVDIDNDGLDDRTERPDSNTEQPWDSTNYNPGGQPTSGDYGVDLLGRVQYGFDTIFYWLTTPFRLVADGFTSIIKTIEESFGWATNFSVMITGLFGFLPGPVVSLLGLAFVTIIIVAVIKVVRG